MHRHHVFLTFSSIPKLPFSFQRNAKLYGQTPFQGVPLTLVTMPMHRVYTALPFSAHVPIEEEVRLELDKLYCSARLAMIASLRASHRWRIPSLTFFLRTPSLPKRILPSGQYVDGLMKPPRDSLSCVRFSCQPYPANNCANFLYKKKKKEKK